MEYGHAPPRPKRITCPHALCRFLPRRNPRPPAGVGGRGQAREAAASRAGSSPACRPSMPEKTPSFFVNDTKGKWFDFSAGKNGDIFTFLMETEGLTFPEAVERLAGEAGVPMPARDPQAEAAREGTRDALRRHGTRRAVLRVRAAEPRRRDGARLSRRTARSVPTSSASSASATRRRIVPRSRNISPARTSPRSR